MIIDVVIAGAGPTGLMLACELRLAGVAPIVLERLPAPTGLSKGLGLWGRAIDALDHPARRVRRPPRAASGKMPATHGGRKTSYQTRIRGLNVLWSALLTRTSIAPNRAMAHPLLYPLDRLGSRPDRR